MFHVLKPFNIIENESFDASLAITTAIKCRMSKTKSKIISYQTSSIITAISCILPYRLGPNALVNVFCMKHKGNSVRKGRKYVVVII